MSLLHHNVAGLKACVLLTLFLGVCLFIAGCGSSGARTEVKGTVTYDGKPLPGGNLSIKKGDDVYLAAIDENGKFRVGGVKPGDVKVRIETESIKKLLDDMTPLPEDPKDDGKDGGKGFEKDRPALNTDSGEKRKYVKIPSDYADYETSGIAWKLSRGTIEKNISLKKDYKFQK